MNKDITVKTLGDVLYHCHDIDWDLALYLGSKDNFHLNMDVIIHDPDDVEDDEQEEPKIIEDNNFFYILSIQDIQSIKENFEQQVNREASREELLKVFDYYYKNDAFIVI